MALARGPVKWDEHAIHFDSEMPAGILEGDAERPEAVLSGRTAAWAETDQVAIAIPWLSRHHELVYRIALAGAHTAAAAAKVPPHPRG